MQKQQANGTLNTQENSMLMNGINESEADTDNAECPCAHEGKEMLNSVYSFPVDQVFSMIFTKNRFIDEIFEGRKISDVVDSQWQLPPEAGNKERKLEYNMALNSALVKSCHSTDTQTLLHSKPGQLYVVECEIVNAGVPHSDSFFLKSHYCLIRASKHETKVQVYGIVKYKKSLWGMIKSMIEKTCMSSLSDFCSGLESAFTEEAERKGNHAEQVAPADETSTVQVEKSQQVVQRKPAVSQKPVSSPQKPTPKRAPAVPSKTIQKTVAQDTNIVNEIGKSAELFISINIILLSTLLFLNCALFYKLWNFEDSSFKVAPTAPQMQLPLTSCFSSENLMRLLKDQETSHRDVTMGWISAFNDLVNLNRMMGESMSDLKRNIQSYANHAVLKNFNLPPEMLKDDKRKT